MSNTASEIIARIPLEGDAVHEVKVWIDDVNSTAIVKLNREHGFGNWFDSDVGTEDLRPSLDEVNSAVSEALGSHVKALSTPGCLEPDGDEISIAFPLPPEPEPDDYIDLRSAIIAAERACQRAEEDLELAKEEASLKKKLYDGAVLRLRRIAREMAEPLPLFEHAKKQAQEPDPEAWRDVPLSEALEGISEGTILKLAEADLSTIGDLADYTNGGKVLIDLPGIGEATAEKILNAQADYWARTTR